MPAPNPRRTPTQGPRDTGLARLRFREIELLLAIHEHRSITAAARALGYTQPAASRALRDIEQLLRVHLFDRDRATGMTPTVAGELALARARALLSDYRSLTAELDAYRAGTGGHMRLGVIPFVSGSIVGELIAELTGERGRMSVSITEGPTTALVEELRLQRLDAAIGRCTSAPLPAGIVQEALLRQQGCLLAPARHPVVRARRFELASLQPFPWLLAPEGTPTRTAINDMFARAGLAPPSAVVEASSTRLIHLALKANARMLSIVPADAGDDVVRLGGVRRLPLPGALELPPVGLMTAERHRDTPAVRNLRETIRAIARRRREI